MSLLKKGESLLSMGKDGNPSLCHCISISTKNDTGHTARSEIIRKGLDFRNHIRC